MFSLNGRIALVSGCGSSYPGYSNGKATALALSRQGARIIGWDYNLDAARDTQALIRNEGGICDVVGCDIRSPKEIEDAFRKTLSLTEGVIDILVNNVGGPEIGDLMSTGIETWKAQFDLNIHGAYLICKQVIPIMIDNGGGSIINIGSTAAIRYTGKAEVAYAASKAALVQMTKVSAVIYAPYKIRMNSILPGLIWTPLVKGLAKKLGDMDYDGLVQSRHRQVPMGTMGDSWDVAHAVVFLASEESRYITGTEIIVDGGLTAATR